MTDSRRRPAAVGMNRAQRRDRANDIENIDIAALSEIDRAMFTNLPNSMECRLFNTPGREPAIVLWHPKAELYVFVSLGHDFAVGPMDLTRYAEQVNTAVLKQAMAEAPEPDGYRTD